MTPQIYLGLPRNIKVNFIVNHRDIKPADILRHVCQYFQLSEFQVLSKSRKHELVMARCHAIYLIKHNCLLTLKEIGSIFGRDHSTIIYNLETYENMFETDSKFKRDVLILREFK